MNKISPPRELPPNKKVVIYLRDSGGARQELSVRDQRNEMEAYCQKHGFIIKEYFEDVALSGTTTVGRDEFDRMIDLCRKKHYTDGLLVWSYARFARNTQDSMYFKSDLRRRGVIIHSITDEIPEGNFSHLIELMIDISNEDKSRQTSRDSKRGLAQRTLDGYVPGGGTPPRGYRIVREIISYHRDGSPRIGTKWEIDPDTGSLATLAFEMRAKFISVNDIMKSPCGVLYKTKGGWTTFFRNKSYLGIGKCGDTEVPNHHPALVNFETWEAVRLIREGIHKRKAGNPLHPKRYHSPSLLSGTAVCIHCGTPIIREVSGAKTTKSGKWISYLCGKKRNSGNWQACEGKQIQTAKADAAAIDTILNIILTKDCASDFINEIRDKFSDDSEIERQGESVRQALVNCENAINRLIDTIETVDSTTAKERLKERENEHARLQFEYSVIESRRKAVQLDISPERLALMLEVWHGDIETAREQNDIRGLQDLLRRFVNKIELGYNNARIWYTYPIEAFAENETRLSKVAPRDRQE